MSANRQAIKQPKSLMFWRYSAASGAIVYGAVLGFYFVVQHILYTISFSHDFRSFKCILALSAGIAVFRGYSTRFIVLVFAVIILLNPDNIWFAWDMVTGRFQYATGMSVHSVLTFLSAVLPYASLSAALIADPLTYRVFEFVRSWPHMERA
jgi:hypothetical protein